MTRATSRLRSYWIRTFRDRSASGCGTSILAGGYGTRSRWAWPARVTAKCTSGHKRPTPLIVTFDEDFADQRAFPVGQHYGVVRLCVWPTTIEMTQFALGRLFEEFTEAELRGGLAIVDRTHIRMRRPQL
jgi:hypothetical protein